MRIRRLHNAIKQNYEIPNQNQNQYQIEHELFSTTTLLFLELDNARNECPKPNTKSKSSFSRNMVARKNKKK